MNVKTSITDPIEVAVVIPPHYPGRENYYLGKIGISLCPGKKGQSSFGGVWDRDLATDLSVIKRDFDAAVIVTLMTDSELSASNVTGLGQAVRDHGMQWFHLPIEEMTSPGESLDEQWAETLSYVLDAITKGHNILVHDRGGLGRSGTLAAMLLIELGMSNEEAVTQVRRARSGAIENREQEGYVNRYVALIGLPPHIFCGYCHATIGKSFCAGGVFDMMEYRRHSYSEDKAGSLDFPLRTEALGLDIDMPNALGILDTYIQDFEHYIGDIGTQVDVIRKALGVRSKPFPQDIENWTRTYPPEPLGSWWHGNPPESSGVAGKFATKIGNWYRLTDAQRNQVRVASRKISRYVTDYRDRTKARDLENNRWFSSPYHLNHFHLIPYLDGLSSHMQDLKYYDF